MRDIEWNRNIRTVFTPIFNQGNAYFGGQCDTVLCAVRLRNKGGERTQLTGGVFGKVFPRAAHKRIAQRLRSHSPRCENQAGKPSGAVWCVVLGAINTPEYMVQWYSGAEKGLDAPETTAVLTVYLVYLLETPKDAAFFLLRCTGTRIPSVLRPQRVRRLKRPTCSLKGLHSRSLPWPTASYHTRKTTGGC